MSEEFVRCENCGNLNIVGTKKCVFCDTEITETAEKIKDPEVQAAEALGVPSVPEVPSEPKEKKEIDLPEVPKAKPAEDKKARKKEIKESVEPDYSIGKKIIFISLLAICVSIIHYGINFLLSFLSIKISDPDINLYPGIPINLEDTMEINAVSILVGFIFAILIGYLFGKIVRRYTSDKKGIRFWVAYAITIDVIINIAAAIVLIIITNAAYVNDLLFIYLSGAVFIFLIFGAITVFIPILTGSFLIFPQIDRIFFPRKYAE
ncbi:MAG: hypothetical protein ACFFDS_04055 [Candidatus Thorarchaeota archaeon]